MKDLTKTMDITMREEEEAAAAEAAAAEAEESAPLEGEQESGTTGTTGTTDATAPPPPPTTAAASGSAPPPKPFVADDKSSVPAADSTLHPTKEFTGLNVSPTASGASTPRPGTVPTRLALEHGDPSDHLTPSEAAQMTEEEKRLREKQKKKGGLSKEQREELAAYELERKRQREERVSNLSKKLIDRLSVWTETDKGKAVTEAFKAQINFEIENLKMESFGLEILHAIGQTYFTKGTSFLKSQKFFGLSGIWSRMKEKGTLAKETWTTISTAIDAQVTMEEMVRMEEKGGEDWTDEKKAEYEKRLTGKILAAAWRGSKFEIQSVLREVCDRILNEKNIKPEKRIERAQGLVVIGEMFGKVKLSLCVSFR
jgi:hypothetical protein